VYLRKGEPFGEVGAGFDVSTATSWRYVNETVDLLADRAPKLRAALRRAQRQGIAFVVIDGTLIPIDRVAADRPFCSGKHRMHGMNLQVISSPDGSILWVSGALPGSTHDTAAARISEHPRRAARGGSDRAGRQGLSRHRPACDHSLPSRGKPASQKTANRAHARLRGPGERANAQLKTWRVLRKLRSSPHRAGRIAKAIHVLQNRELAAG
jgi:hypothetical protein